MRESSINPFSKMEITKNQLELEGKKLYEALRIMGTPSDQLRYTEFFLYDRKDDCFMFAEKFIKQEAHGETIENHIKSLFPEFKELPPELLSDEQIFRGAVRGQSMRFSLSEIDEELLTKAMLMLFERHFQDKILKYQKCKLEFGKFMVKS